MVHYSAPGPTARLRKRLSLDGQRAAQVQAVHFGASCGAAAKRALIWSKYSP